MTRREQTEQDRVVRETVMEEITEAITSHHAQIKQLAEAHSSISFKVGRFHYGIEIEPDEGLSAWYSPSVNISAEEVAVFAGELADVCEISAASNGLDVDDHHHWTFGREAAEPFCDGSMLIDLDEGAVSLTLRFPAPSYEDEDEG